VKPLYLWKFLPGPIPSWNVSSLVGQDGVLCSGNGSTRPVPEHQNLVPHLVLKTIWFLFWFWNGILKSYPIPVKFLLPGTIIDDSYHETEYLPITRIII
jgi:hypothetical protein